jgi:hypothetical protein
MADAPAYRLAIEGETSRFDEVLRQALSVAFEPFGLTLGDEVAVDIALGFSCISPGRGTSRAFFRQSRSADQTGVRVVSY